VAYRSEPIGRWPRTPDLRLLTAIVVCVALAGFADGSQWKSLLTPTLAYRPAVLFGFALLFGWRGFVWGQLVFLAAFVLYLGLQATAFVEPLNLFSYAIAFLVARNIKGKDQWLTGERSTLAFMAGAALAPAIPALLNAQILRIIGATLRPGVPAAVDSWVRGSAGILCLVPAMLVYGSGGFQRWVGFPSESERRDPTRGRHFLELGIETAVWSLTLWASVRLKARYGFNVTYLTFLPLLAFALLRGMRPATLALAANAVIATTLWSELHWSALLPLGDLRLLIGIYSMTTLVLAAVVDERQRRRGQIEELLAAERVLRESEKYFRMVANSAPLMIWATGPDHRCNFVNKQLLDFTGRTMEEEAGRGWADGLHPEDVASCMAELDSAFSAGRPFGVECRFRRADGEYRWVVSHGVPLYRDGQFTGYIGSFVDITDQKLAIERLRQSELQLASAQRLARVGSFERDIQKNTMKWSAEKLRMIGLPTEPSSLAVCLNYVHPKDHRKFLEIEKRVGSATTPVEVEYRIIRPDGEGRVIRSIVEGVRDSQGTLIRVVGASQDITERVQARERLQESEQRLKIAQEIAHFGSWHWDLECDRVTCSEECLRIFGQRDHYSPTFGALLETISPCDRKRVADQIQSALADNQSRSMEFQIIRPGGELRTVTFTFQVVLDGEGHPRQLIGACQDVTEARRAQQEAFARQKLETVGTLANGIAHDFNNLLGNMMAQAELALTTVDAGLAPKQELKAICDVAARGSEIVRELMIYAGTEGQSLAPVDISQSVEGMLELLKVSVSKHASIETNLAKNLPAVRANPARISQLILNLVTNASEALGDRDGTIRVSTERVTAGSKPQHIQLEITDTGCGIPPETQARVFEPFFSTKSPGRGLGLAVIDGIVRGLGGAIQLESKPGAGTTVRVLLPVESDSGEIPRPYLDSPPESRRARFATALVVEDEEFLRNAVSKILARQDMQVIEAANGADALATIRASQAHIDVLVLDISIPGASSREVIEEARRSRPEMSVIIASAYTKDMAAKTLQHPIQYFLRKPYRMAELADMIRRAVA
jgi:PAS domain S-box-containing protein